MQEQFPHYFLKDKQSNDIFKLFCYLMLELETKQTEIRLEAYIYEGLCLTISVYGYAIKSIKNP